MDPFNSENSACLLGAMPSIGNTGQCRSKIKTVRDKICIFYKYASCVLRFPMNGYQWFTLRE